MQKYIRKNIEHLSIGVTIDGTRRKHDLNRIWKGEGPERGSYEDVVKNIPLWLSQFPEGVKSFKEGMAEPSEEEMNRRVEEEIQRRADAAQTERNIAEIQKRQSGE